MNLRIEIIQINLDMWSKGRSDKKIKVASSNNNKQS